MPCTVRASGVPHAHLVPCAPWYHTPLILPFPQAVASCPSWLGQQTDTIASKVTLVEEHLRLLLDSAASSSSSEMADTDPQAGVKAVQKMKKKPKANSMSVTGADGSSTDGSKRQAARLFLGFPGLLSVSADKVRFCILAFERRNEAPCPAGPLHIGGRKMSKHSDQWFVLH